MALRIRERWARVGEKVNQSELMTKTRTLFDSLSPRDRRLFLLLISFFSLMIVAGCSYLARGYLHRFEQDITRKQAQLDRIEQVRASHVDLQAQIDGLEEELKKDPDFNLTAFLERTAGEVGFAESINIQTKGEVANSGFREVSVEVRLRKAPLDKIVRYLYLVETAPQRPRIKSLRIQTTFGSRADLDTHLEVSVLAPQET